MRNKQASSVLGLIFVASLLLGGCGPSNAQPEEGVLDVWTTWAGDPAQLQDLLERYSLASGLPVRVTAGVKSARLSKALAGPTPPDLVILSSSAPVNDYHKQGLIEPLDAWIESSGIDLDDLYAASLAQCETPAGAPEGETLCLPWGCDVYALFWNKDLFQAAGLDPERPPRTMDELAEYAARLTVLDGKGDLAQVGFVPDLFRPHTDLYARMMSGTRDGVGSAGYSSAGSQIGPQAMLDAADWQRAFYERHGAEEVQAFVRSFNLYMNSSHPVDAGKRLNCQQCHRAAPGNAKKMPDRGFYNGKVAMVVEGQWQVGPHYISRFQPDLNYGVAPFPPPAGHPERAHTALVEGPVVVLPAGARDKEQAAALLAWMMSPEIAAEQAYASTMVPSSRRAARDPRFEQFPNWQVFVDLVAHPNAYPAHNPPLDPSLGG